MRVGIFWFYNDAIFGKATELIQGEVTVGGIIDSPDNHADFWTNNPDYLMRYPELSGREYFEVPRGRVLYDQTQNRPIVYLDATMLSAHVKQLVCGFFDLEQVDVLWRDDLHYKTSTADLAQLFND